MRTLKRILTLTILLVITNLIYAQDVVRFLNEYYNNRNLRSIEERYEEVEGMPYLDKNFVSSILRVKSGEVFRGDLRYNIYTDEMELKSKENKFYVIYPPEDMKEIELGSNIFIYSQFIEKSNNEKGYFLKKADGEYKFLIKKQIVLTEAEREEPYKAARPAKFNESPDKFFIKKGDSPAIYFKNAKDLFEIIPEKKNTIEKYLESNKIKTKKIESWIKFFNYLNRN